MATIVQKPTVGQAIVDDNGRLTLVGVEILQRFADAILELQDSAPPAGGTTGQALTKNSATDYDMDWA